MSEIDYYRLYKKYKQKYKQIAGAGDTDLILNHLNKDRDEWHILTGVDGLPGYAEIDPSAPKLESETQSQGKTIPGPCVSLNDDSKSKNFLTDFAYGKSSNMVDWEDLKCPRCYFDERHGATEFCMLFIEPELIDTFDSGQIYSIVKDEINRQLDPERDHYDAFYEKYDGEEKNRRRILEILKRVDPVQPGDIEKFTKLLRLSVSK